MPNTKDSVFYRVEVDHVTQGGTRVSWSMADHFNLLDPHTFQLQVAESFNDDATWTDVGAAFSDEFYAVDDEARNYSNIQYLHYRVEVTTPNGTWYSAAAPAYGKLRPKDWRFIRATLRRHNLHLNKFQGAEGLLLRRKWSGTRPQEGVFETDPITDEPIKSRTSSTLGTEFIGGYFNPAPFKLLLSLGSVQNLRDLQSGTANPEKSQAVCSAFPQINSNDVWVHRGSDIRYAIKVKNTLESIKGVPIIYGVSLAPMPKSHPVYDIDVSEYWDD